MTTNTTLTLLAAVLLSSCAVGEGSPCSPVSSDRHCLSQDEPNRDKAYDCQGPEDAKGMGTIRIVEDCAASGKVCAAFTAQDGQCMDKAEYCALNISPKPEKCQ